MNDPTTMAPPKVGLIGMPTELKDFIITRLSQQDLNNLSKTCKKMRFASLSALYKNVLLTNIAIPLLRRTLMESPGYADSIGSIDIHGDMNTKTTDSPSYSWKSSSAKSTAKNYPGVSLLLLLAQCPRLESFVADLSIWLYLQHSISKQVTALGSAESFLTVRPECLQFGNLQRFIVRCPIHSVVDSYPQLHDNYNPTLIPEVLPWLLNLPSLDHLEIPLLPPLRRERLGAGEGASATTTLRTLKIWHLTRPYLPRDSLEVLLRRTPNLEELYYDLKPYNEDNRDAHELSEALHCVQATLVRLTIRFEVYVEGEPDDLSTSWYGALGSLRMFPALTSLNISLGVLYGVENTWSNASTAYPTLGHLLPPNLKSLVINDDLWYHHENQYRGWSGQVILDLVRRFVTTDYKWATPDLEEFTLDLSGSLRELDEQRAGKHAGYLEDFEVVELKNELQAGLGNVKFTLLE